MDQTGPRSESEHDHPADHDGASARWVWRDKPLERQPTEPTQPPPASEFRRQPDFTPKAVGTWAAENKGSRVPYQAYQQNQHSGNSCSMVTHACAMMVSDSGHVCGTKHPGASIGGTISQPSKMAGIMATNADEAQLLVRIAAGNQQLSRDNRLQKPATGAARQLESA